MRELRLKYGMDYEQPMGVPMLTEGYNLPAGKVVHVVGPIVQHRLTQELKQQLAACNHNVLELCGENGLKSVAFCCLSTGVFRFPNKRAAEIAVSTTEQWLKEHPHVIDRVVFNVFKDIDLMLYENCLGEPEAE